MLNNLTKDKGIPPQWSGPDLQWPSTTEFQAVLATVQAIPMAAVAHTLDYRLIAVNDDCAALLKIAPGGVTGRPVSDFIPPADRPTALETARAVVRTSSQSARPASALRRLTSGDGQELTCWMHIGLATIGGYECFVACIDLVNPVLSDAHRWRHRAEHDELTGLRRRGALLGQVAQWVDSGRVVMLAFLDIDNFKSINDTHGHAAGDRVLITLARRLEQHAPAGAVVGRLSGDEFVVAHTVNAPPGPEGHEQRQAAAANMMENVGPRSVAEPMAWGDHLLTISISVGVTIGDLHEDPSNLLSRADCAMYAQKSQRVRPRRHN